MRVLFACSMGGSGHLLPLLEVAAGFIDQGHEGVVLVPPSMVEAASSAGLEVVVGAQPPREFVEALWSRVRAGPPEHVLGLIDRQLFAGRAADVMLEPAREAVVDFTPDLIVREPSEYAAAIAAHETGVRQVQVAISAAAVEASVLEMVADDLERRCPGVVDRIRRAPYLTAFASLVDPSPWQDTRRYRHDDVETVALPDWWPTLRERPLLYMTFGSVLGGMDEAESVYRTALSAIADLPIRALLTVGRHFDTDRLGRLPANSHVEAWVRQADVLAVADLVLCHGGSGTTNATLAAGLPLVVCPLFADQSRNALTVQRLGAGIVVQSEQPASGGVATLGTSDAPALRAAISACLNDPAFRRQAQNIRTAMSGTATISETVKKLMN